MPPFSMLRRSPRDRKSREKQKVEDVGDSNATPPDEDVAQKDDEVSTEIYCKTFEVDFRESHHQPLSGEELPRSPSLSEAQRR
ncbi:hypothetical protein MFIFM68171_02426 [Madurella fahalii]|uniref:Uncharacterized protein n=1 Tax=Madurella fahalii TaxID=1157608 RepID=A0ABQ0G375_9PEZI